MIPNLIEKKPLPKKIPTEMKIVIKKLKQSKDRRQCLKQAYNILTKRFKGYHFGTYVHIEEAYDYDLKRMWHSKYLHCTKLNYLLRLLLVKSGFFKEKDIQQVLTVNYGFSPHQYLKIDDIDVDVWGKTRKISFGKHAGL